MMTARVTLINGRDILSNKGDANMLDEEGCLGRTSESRITKSGRLGKQTVR